MGTFLGWKEKYGFTSAPSQSLLGQPLVPHQERKGISVIGGKYDPFQKDRSKIEDQDNMGEGNRTPK
jgi:hypothetical protein